MAKRVKPDRVSAIVRFSCPVRRERGAPWKTVELGAEAPVPQGVSALSAHRQLYQQLAASLILAVKEWPKDQEVKNG